MNIDDADIPITVFATDIEYFRSIFDHQQQLMSKYHGIEEANGFLIPESNNLNDKFLQQRIKDFFWRAAEEFAEATEVQCQLGGWRALMSEDSNIRHTFEELSDVLHFLVEGSIISNFTPEQAELAYASADRHLFETQSSGVPWISFEHSCWHVVKHLGLAANCLKNKPWKVTHVETNVERFYAELTMAWVKFMSILRSLNMTIAEIHQLYIKKNNVNQFRQASRY